MYQVEAILDKKIDKKTNKQCYFVKWVGYDAKQSTWEPVTHLKYCQQLIDKFQNKEKKTTTVSHEQGKRKGRRTMRLTRKISKRRKKEKKDHNIEDAIDVDKLMQSDEMEEPHKNNQLVEEEQILSFGQVRKEKERQKPKERLRPMESLQILGMKRKGLNYEYYIKADEAKEWKEHDWVLDNYPRQLCLFYEKNLMFQG